MSDGTVLIIVGLASVVVMALDVWWHVHMWKNR